jgi:hypothetical protein
MDMDRLRKDAKALHRGVQRGETEAERRAARVLGDRAARRFQLSDAQHVVAVELGFGSWPRLRAAARAQIRPDDAGPPPVELVEPGLLYVAGDPVRLRIVTRRFPEVDDGGGAVARSGRPPGWLAVATRVARERDVNVNRAGVLSLPIVPCGPGRETIMRRVAEASVVLFGELLEIAERGA